MKIIYNPRNGAKIKDIFEKKEYVHSVDKMIKYEDKLADYLLKKYGFLMELTVKEAKKMIEKEKMKYKCQYCNFATNVQVALSNHEKTHQKPVEEEIEGLEEVQSANGKRFVTKDEENRGIPRHLSPEELEGIPLGGTKYHPRTDREGVGWYGEGVEDDREFLTRRKGQKYPGAF